MWQNWLFFLTVLAVGVSIPDIHAFFDARDKREAAGQASR
jgi:hypothetical protein